MDVGVRLQVWWSFEMAGYVWVYACTVDANSRFQDGCACELARFVHIRYGLMDMGVRLHGGCKFKIAGWIWACACSTDSGCVDLYWCALAR